MKLKISNYNEIRNWMYRNARSIDLARWQYHFEQGSKENVLKALAAYQNQDGGFGHALEADSWNTNSSPIQTWRAFEIVHEIKGEANNPIVKGILSYLNSGKDFNGSHWLAQIPSNNDCPHAPWWTFTDEEKAVWGYNPTAALAGFILLYETEESELYNKALNLATQAIDVYLSNSLCDNMHELSCYLRLAECIEKDNIDIKNYNSFISKLKEDVEHIIEKDIEKWKNQYCATPSRFIQSQESLYYEKNAKLIDAELDIIIASINEEGVWNIPWNWGIYEHEFAISENWWKANAVIDNVKLLKNFNRIEEI